MVSKDILNSHPISTLKKEISKTNIKGYSKMKKSEVVSLMLKNKERFVHIKMNEKTKKSVAKPTPKVAEKPKKKIKFKVVKKKKEPETKFSDLEEVSVRRYGGGSKRKGYGSNVYIDNKTGKVYDDEDDFNKDEYTGDIVTIKRPGKSDMKGIRIFHSNVAKPDLIFGKDFDLSYPYDYNYVDFKSYSVKKLGFKNIPAVKE